MGPTQTLCEFSANLSRRDIPDDVFERALYITLDGLGCGLFAAKLDWSARAVHALTEDEDGGRAAIWGWNQPASATLSALLNGTFIQGSELDDYHPYPLHSASVVLPSVLGAAAHANQLTGEEACIAIVIGFETGPRIAKSMGGWNILRQGWHCGSVYGAIASAVAASRALALDALQTEDALGIAATQACGLMSAQFESMVKRMNHGFAARNGLTGAMLARRGFTGIRAVLEREYGGFATVFTGGNFDLSAVTDGLGEDWELRNIGIKPPWTSMGVLHTPIEAVCDMKREGLAAEDVESVRVGLTEIGYKHGGWQLERPAAVVGAQMNVAYAVAVTLLDGEPSLEQFSPPRINSDEVWHLMERVETYVSPDLDELGEPGIRFASRVEVTTRSGATLEREIVYPVGDPRRRPFSNDEIVAKFRRITNYVMEEDRQQRVIEAVLGLPSAPNTSLLVEALSGHVRAPLNE